MRLVDAWRQVPIWNEAVWISSPQEQAELPDHEEAVGDSHRPAVKGGQPSLNGHLKVHRLAPFEGLPHEAVKNPQHPLGAVVFNATRALEFPEEFRLDVRA